MQSPKSSNFTKLGRQVISLALCALLGFTQPLALNSPEKKAKRPNCLSPVLISTKTISNFTLQLNKLSTPQPAPAFAAVEKSLKDIYPDAFNKSAVHHDEHDVSNVKTLASVLGLAFSFGTIELVFGCAMFGSMALGADAMHMFADSFGLLTSLGANLMTAALVASPPPAIVRLLGKINYHNWIYMEKDGTSVWKMLSSLTIASLMGISGWHIIQEALIRLSNPAALEVMGLPVFVIAVTGLLVNLLNSWILDGKSIKTFPLLAPVVRIFTRPAPNAPSASKAPSIKETIKEFASMFTVDSDMDMSLWAAKLHFLGDILGSVSAIVVAIVIIITGNTWVDLIGSTLVGAWMFINTALIAKEVIGLPPSYTGTVQTLSRIHCQNMQAGKIKMGQLSAFCSNNPSGNKIAKKALVHMAQSHQWILSSSNTIQLHINGKDTLEIHPNGTVCVEQITLPITVPRYQIRKTYKELKKLWKKDIARHAKPTIDVFEKNAAVPALQTAA